MKFTNETREVIALPDGRCVPCDPNNRDFAALVVSKALVEPADKDNRREVVAVEEMREAEQLATLKYDRA